MPQRLRKYLFDAFNTNPYLSERRHNRDLYFQIDDQDDYDVLTEFVTVFVTVHGRQRFEIEIRGDIPIVQQLVDLLDIYHGTVDPVEKVLRLPLTIRQLPVITDLCSILRVNATIGSAVWRRHAARTISSLTRFSRIMAGFQVR